MLNDEHTSPCPGPGGAGASARLRSHARRDAAAAPRRPPGPVRVARGSRRRRDRRLRPAARPRRGRRRLLAARSPAARSPRRGRERHRRTAGRQRHAPDDDRARPVRVLRRMRRDVHPLAAPGLPEHRRDLPVVPALRHGLGHRRVVRADPEPVAAEADRQRRLEQRLAGRQAPGVLADAVVDRLAGQQRPRPDRLPRPRREPDAAAAASGQRQLHDRRRLRRRRDRARDPHDPGRHEAPGDQGRGGGRRAAAAAPGHAGLDAAPAEPAASQPA